MEALFDHGLSAGAVATLFVCLAVALAFEFVNGFHDTANAVATVIYTNTPPPGVRALLVATCSGVSFAHGSNDGQKGVGLVMLILIGIVPGGFARDLTAGHERVDRTLRATTAIEQTLTLHADAAAQPEAARARAQLAAVRQSVLLADKALEKLVKAGGLGLTAPEQRDLERQRKALRNLTDYAPTWVLFAIALALGVGTMFGWKRVVVTVGEKIGKAHLTYAQGASAEIVAAGAIGFASLAGLPVSTTHVLSSGVAGTMVANGSGVQPATVRNIALAWVLTLPASAAMAAVLFTVFRLALG